MRVWISLLVAGVASAVAAQEAAPTEPGSYLITVQGDTLRGDVSFNDPFLGKAHVVLDGERREIEEFREIRLDGETLAVVDGRRLARLVEDGRVRLYSRETSTAPVMVPSAGPGGGMMMSGGVSDEIGYVQVGQGPIERATVPALRRALQDNPESIRYLDRYKTLGVAQVLVTVAGVGAFVGGVVPMIQANENGEDVSPSPLLFVGAGTLAAAQFAFPSLKRSARRRAIEAYNR